MPLQALVRASKPRLTANHRSRLSLSTVHYDFQCRLQPKPKRRHDGNFGIQECLPDPKGRPLERQVHRVRHQPRTAPSRASASLSPRSRRPCIMQGTSGRLHPDLKHGSKHDSILISTIGTTPRPKPTSSTAIASASTTWRTRHQPHVVGGDHLVQHPAARIKSYRPPAPTTRELLNQGQQYLYLLHRAPLARVCSVSRHSHRHNTMPALLAQRECGKSTMPRWESDWGLAGR
jgi:hypothetical protein